MPGPGQKKKPKAKPTSASSSLPKDQDAPGAAEAYVGRIDHAEGWIAIADILCHVFELPDINTRSGLKKVHANFDAIYRKLEKASQQYSGNLKIVGGIASIYAKMCSDAILRNKLWEKGLLKKLLPLLDDQFTMHMALRALGTITHHGGAAIRIEIATHSPRLSKLLEEYSDDATIAELVISVFSHSLGAVLDTETKPDKKTLAKIDVRNILKLATEMSRKEWASPWLIHHAVFLLAMSTLHAPEECAAYPPMQRLLVAGLRSNEWVTRCICLGGLIRLHRKGAEDEVRQMDPNKLIACVQRGFKDHLSDVMVDYGPTQCDTYLTLSIANEYQRAMMTAAQDRNLYSLGLKLASFIPRTEFSIADGMFLGEDPRTGKREAMDVGLPFTRWIDALPPCAKAIRARGYPKEEDLADMLDIKYLVMKQRTSEGISLARKGLLRNPEQAYFYYAATLSANRVEGLKAAKKGLKCKQITPFLRFQMLQRAVEHAGDLGITILQESPRAGKEKWEEGIAFLMSALDDAKTFVAEAPPDNRYRNAVLYFCILLTITIKGPEMSQDLKELQPYIKAQQLADEFMQAIQIKPPNTNMRLAEQTVVKLYPAACKEFGKVIEKIQADEALPIISPKKAEDDLAAWLEDTHVHDHDHDGQLHGMHPKVNLNDVALYRCSHCGNPSAVLRKCSGCSKARYCDASCQKANWKDHKRTCTGA